MLALMLKTIEVPMTGLSSMKLHPIFSSFPWYAVATTIVELIGDKSTVAVTSKNARSAQIVSCRGNDAASTLNAGLSPGAHGGKLAGALPVVTPVVGPPLQPSGTRMLGWFGIGWNARRLLQNHR